MATVTQENLGLLHEKLNVTLKKEDYLPGFERAIKDYSKKANMPGFRKGQVPAGLIKKMYGTSVFTDEVLRSVDRELMKFLEDTRLEIFAQPLPLEMDIQKLNMNNPEDYTFSFEIGMKPPFQLPDFSNAKISKYNVTVTDDMVNQEVERLTNRYGNMKDLTSVESEENVVNVTFIEADENAGEIEGGTKKDNSLLVKYFKEEFRNQLLGKHINDYVVLQLKNAFDDKEREWLVQDLGLDKEDPASLEKHFKMVITKIGQLEKRELNEEFFNQLYPNQDIKTESDFRNKVRAEIKAHFDAQATNQIHDQVFHFLVDNTTIDFPESFLKRWIKTQGDKTNGEKTDEQVDQEFPTFLNQLKWTLITDKIVQDNKIEVKPEELRDFAKQQLLGYMGMQALDEEQSWVRDYIDKMMKDRRFVEDAYNRVQTTKIFEWAAQQVKAEDKDISAEEFTHMVQEHQHHHH